MYSSIMTPVCTETPNSARKPTPEETLKLVCVDQKSEQTADGRHGNVDENEDRPLAGVEHGVKNDEDSDDGDGQHKHQPARGALLALVLAGPVDLVARWQLNLIVYLYDRLFDGAAQIAVAHAVLDGDIALATLPVHLFCTIFSL